MSWNLPFGKKKLETIITSRNDAVREALAKHGDDGVAARHVVHYAYPAKAADLSSRPQILASLQAQGFEVKDAVADNGVVFEHHRSVHPGDFDDLTDTLSAWFEERGWNYDGWECAVATNGRIN
jgi:hypothetical protein